MIELINVVTYACPFETNAEGCSETLELGVIQETFGNPCGRITPSVSVYEKGGCVYGYATGVVG